MVRYILGKVLMVGAALMCAPLLVAVLLGEEVLAFAVPGACLLLLGAILTLHKPKRDHLYARESFLIVALSWVGLSLFGALPYRMALPQMGYLDCLFESVSGFTTTGASVFADVEALPASVLFWRSFTQWVGGMGVLVFMLAVLPQSEAHSVRLASIEQTGPSKGKLVSRGRISVRILYGIYAGMTLLLFALLLLGGMPPLDSLLHAFGTAATGGFGIKNTSVAFYNSPYIETVIAVFMVLFGVNFSLYFLLIGRNFLQVLKNEELYWYLGIIALATGLIALNLRSVLPGLHVRDAFFQVSSIITTTGFSTVDFNRWPSFSKAVLLFIMILGGCAGSTAGGMKISRFLILVKSLLVELRAMLSPRSVQVVRVEGHPAPAGVVRTTAAFFSAYMLIIALSILLLTAKGLDLESAASAVITGISNVGPGLGEVGPASSFQGLPNLSKAVLIFDMLAGRLELFPLLMLFSPAAWRGR